MKIKIDINNVRYVDKLMQLNSCHMLVTKYILYQIQQFYTNEKHCENIIITKSRKVVE